MIENKTQKETKVRNSSIELLKVFGMIIIILNHVVQTLVSVSTENGYGIDFNGATTSIRDFIILVFRYSGNFGNMIFFVCSAWFLLSSKKSNKKKIMHMMANIWVVSVVICLLVLIFGNADLSLKK